MHSRVLLITDEPAQRLNLLFFYNQRMSINGVIDLMSSSLKGKDATRTAVDANSNKSSDEYDSSSEDNRTERMLAEQHAYEEQLEQKKGKEKIIENTFEPKSNMRRAKENLVFLDKEQLLVSKSKRCKEFGRSKEVFLVDFEVIIVTMDKQLLDTFKTMAKPLLDHYRAVNKSEKQWSLHANGYFVNGDQGQRLAIVDEKMIYEGITFLTPQNVLQPDVMGLLITQAGIYKGHFRRGKAHGQGFFREKKTGATYSGTWEEGILVDGKIKNEEFKFHGHFENGVANGRGKVMFKKSKSQYVGNFHDGRYHSIEEKARYQTREYIYEGHFLDGKKEGEGVLVEFPRDKVAKNTKYRPADQFDGKWMDDYYITFRHEREQQKINFNNGMNLMAEMFEFAQQQSDVSSRKDIAFSQGFNKYADITLNPSRPAPGNTYKNIDYERSSNSDASSQNNNIRRTNQPKKGGENIVRTQEKQGTVKEELGKTQLREGLGKSQSKEFEIKIPEAFEEDEQDSFV